LGARRSIVQDPVKRFATRAAWESWLARNHQRSDGIWVELAKKESGLRSVSRPDALEVALCYGWIDGQSRSVDEHWWRQRFTPRRPRSKWSKINCAAVERLHAEGRLAPAGIREMEAARQDGRWEAAYASPRSITVPEDLEAALRKSPAARREFGALDSRNRYAILYRLHDTKKPETRARRLARFLRMLESGERIYPPR
jgi:uncharacterized protein YdeI (YjbR/CyaY-like superfamily)